MKYIQLSRSLAEFSANCDDLKKIFKDGYNLTTIKADCKWNEIILDNADVRNSLLENNIKLLIGMIAVMSKSDNRLECACTASVLHAFQNSSFLPVKTKCIRYFKKIFERNTRTDLNLLPVLQIALEQTITIHCRLDLWLCSTIIPECDVHKFYRAASNLFGIRELEQYFASTADRQIVLRICLSLIAERTSVESELRNKFVASIIRFTANILQSSTSGEHIDDVMAIFDRNSGLSPSVMQLFEYCTLNALKQCDSNQNVFEIASRLVDTIFLDLLNANAEKSFIGTVVVNYAKHRINKVLFSQIIYRSSLR